MMTSRSEYRLLLRQDNADIRLTGMGYDLGLVSEEKYQRMKNKEEETAKELRRIEKEIVPPGEEINNFLAEKGTSPLVTGASVADLVRRPQLTYNDIAPFDKGRRELPFDVREQVEISLKYEGYISRQMSQAKQFKRLENRKLPDDINYEEISGLRLEARQKLSKIRPLSIGQASRISGVSPADIAVLIVFLDKQ
jgi:tRNA uridine 5-carboxymethylaminomethyl modification enzyme